MDTVYLYGYHFLSPFLVCGILYYKTYKTLKKYEKEFAKELNKLSEQKKNSFGKI